MVLSAGHVAATFLPDLGMLGTSLVHRGGNVVALPGGLAGYRQGRLTGLALLSPWANRLGRWSYDAAGVHVDLRGLPLAEDGAGLPIHGTMTAQPGWRVERAEGAALTASFDTGARPDLLAAFPFPHELVVDAGVDAGGLTVTTTLRATGDRAVPVSFGWHPYLRLPGRRPRASWRLRLPECRHLELDRRGLPTGAWEASPGECRPIGTRTFDDLYALDGDGRLAIEDDGGAVEVECGEGYRYAQVYVPPGHRFACLEPMTAPTNALVTGECAVVEPGDAFVARFSVRPRLRASAVRAKV